MAFVGLGLAEVVSETLIGQQRLGERRDEFIIQHGIQFESLAHVGGVDVAVGSVINATIG